MADETKLKEMESFFLAMADKTRLRLLNLMRDGEICVCFFTEILGESQPKISRHLAYLRNAGVVDARRDGKWMHYSIRRPADPAAAAVLDAILDWAAGLAELQRERERYSEICCSPELLVQIARTPMPFVSADFSDDLGESETDDIGFEEQRREELADYLL